MGSIFLYSSAFLENMVLDKFLDRVQLFHQTYVKKYLCYFLFLFLTLRK